MGDPQEHRWDHHDGEYRCLNEKSGLEMAQSPGSAMSRRS